MPDRIRDLDRRRRWALLRAPVWFVVGTVVTTLLAAVGEVIATAGLARGWSMVSGDGFEDVPVWDWGAVAVLVTLMAVPAVLIAGVLGGWLTGMSRRVLRDIGARPISEGDPAVLTNVVDALALGLGVEAPEVQVIDDPAPNALSVRAGPRSCIVATTGLGELPRHEVEAIAAHELGHLHARDARWVTAAMASMHRTRLVAGVLTGIGSVLLMLFGLAAEGGELLPTPLMVGLLLTGVGSLILNRARWAQRRLREEEDELADVVAVELARQPGALEDVCRRLAADTRIVARSTPHADLLWFKATASTADIEPPAGFLPEPAPPGEGSVEVRTPDAAAVELLARAARASVHRA